MVLHNYDFSQLKTVGYGGDLQMAVNITFALTDKWAFYIGGTPMWDSGDPHVWQVLYDAGVTLGGFCITSRILVGIVSVWEIDNGIVCPTDDYE